MADQAATPPLDPEMFDALNALAGFPNLNLATILHKRTCPSRVGGCVNLLHFHPTPNTQIEYEELDFIGLTREQYNDMMGY